jgi:cysteine synthase
LFVGPSAALNVVGAVKAALRLRDKQLKQGGDTDTGASLSALAESSEKVLTVVTILCDGGER